MPTVNKQSIIESLTEDYKLSVEILFDRMYETIHLEGNDYMDGFRPDYKVTNYILELFTERCR